MYSLSALPEQLAVFPRPYVPAQAYIPPTPYYSATYLARCAKEGRPVKPPHDAPPEAWQAYGKAMAKYEEAREKGRCSKRADAAGWTPCCRVLVQSTQGTHSLPLSKSKQVEES
eukprot:TRINITY_DN9985_c0_g1_i1.p1 TRINITY_DN9985_c0_g1~~TRINITY_DN9985_c0_g1_i1.p1  ORF type:complete len:114 (-),score=5.40 TRINITY_DN9985_c0_g1_i1:214-555(-)